MYMEQVLRQKCRVTNSSNKYMHIQDKSLLIQNFKKKKKKKKKKKENQDMLRSIR